MPRPAGLQKQPVGKLFGNSQLSRIDLCVNTSRYCHKARAAAKALAYEINW